MKNTIFLVRVTFDGLSVDSSFTFDQVENLKEKMGVIRVADRLDGGHTGLGDVFPELATAEEAYKHMRLRQRFNSDMRGPFKVTSEHQPSDGELIEWFRTHHEQVQGERKAGKDQDASR